MTRVLPLITHQVLRLMWEKANGHLCIFKLIFFSVNKIIARSKTRQIKIALGCFYKFLSSTCATSQDSACTYPIFRTGNDDGNHTKKNAVCYISTERYLKCLTRTMVKILQEMCTEYTCKKKERSKY